jgi:hypothetical protein
MKTPARKPLRLWPNVAIAILQVLVTFAIPVVAPDNTLLRVLAGPACTLAVVLWWVFFSRAPWSERLGAVGLMIAALLATSRIIDKSLATGAQGMLFPILAIPVLGFAFVVWAVATRCFSDGSRCATMVATILLSCGVWALVKTGGFTASGFHNDLQWRWAKTPEEQLLTKSGNEPGALPPVGATTEAPEKRLVAKAGVALADGTLLWEHPWPGYPIVQPALTEDGDVLMSVSDSSGTRRLGLGHRLGGWTIEERWTSIGLKPYFNDFVVHNGHAFGLDGSILGCIDLKDGKRT